MVERDSRTAAPDQSFKVPTLPRQLVYRRGRDFVAVVALQRDPLSTRWSTQEIAAIELDFQALKRAYVCEEPLQAVLDNCNSKTTFVEGREIVRPRFERLEKCCGGEGMTTAFPGTATTESGFSVLKWEKNDSRLGLSDFSLEGILHAWPEHHT